MAKKIKSDGSCIDEADRTMYATFCNAANSLSQLYTQAESQQKLAFRAGERHSLEIMYQWILRQEEDGKRITASDVILRLQIAPDTSDTTFTSVTVILLVADGTSLLRSRLAASRRSNSRV